MSEVVLSAADVTKVYRMGEVDVHALRGVSIELHRGELMVMLGASGSGKSTLLNIIGGLDTPTSGSVHYGSLDLSHASDGELTKYRREHVGFVFQFYNLIPSLTAEENIALVTELSDDPMEPREALEMVDLADRATHFPSQLSGGQQQRVAIARAIAKRPDVLLCDEPTGALDFSTGVRILEVIKRINEEFGTTTAIITHNAGVGDMSHRVITLSDGSVSSMETNDAPCEPSELSW